VAVAASLVFLCLVVLRACTPEKPTYRVSEQDIPPATVHPSADLSLEERLRVHMESLTSDFCLGRQTGTRGASRSAQYVAGEFTDIGLSPAFEDGYVQAHSIGWFNDLLSARWSGVIPGLNVVGVLGNPSRQPTIVICAHRDAVAGPGAIDNASGTAALMETARMLSTDPRLGASVVFLSVDGEGIGLTGSKEFVRHLPFDKSSLSYVMILDCIGVRGSNTTLMYATAGNDTVAAVQDAVSDSLKAAEFNVSFTKLAGWSDDETFENAGHPAVFVRSLGGGLDLYIHTPNDTVETVDPRALAAIVRAVVDGMVRVTPKGQ
jgi:hypothetical protein